MDSETAVKELIEAHKNLNAKLEVARVATRKLSLMGSLLNGNETAYAIPNHPTHLKMMDGKFPTDHIWQFSNKGVLPITSHIRMDWVKTPNDLGPNLVLGQQLYNAYWERFDTCEDVAKAREAFKQLWFKHVGVPL